MLEAVRVSEHVFWVGAVDWDIRDFHGYLTRRGTTYNSYLVVGQKTALIDSVKAPFVDEMLERIGSVINPNDISIVVSNHAEPDHASGLRKTIEVVKPEKIVASPRGVKALSQLYSINGVEAVKTDQTLSLGNLTLLFIETPMVHWPDSMFTYLLEEEVLFSQDGFGMHLATNERFADELPYAILYEESSRYYANILMPFSQRISRLIDDVKKRGIGLSFIAPDHGPIWRDEQVGKVLSWYSDWALGRGRKKKAVLIYDTMWGNTKIMAKAVNAGLVSEGIETKVMGLKGCHRSDVASELLNAAAILVGSPTINNNLFPSVADVLTYIKGLRPRNYACGAFGSYGWSGEAPNIAVEILKSMKLEPEPPVRVQYTPTKNDIKICFELGRETAKKIHKLFENG